MNSAFRPGDGSLVGRHPQGGRELRRQRPLSAPNHREDFSGLPPQYGTGPTKDRQQWQQQTRQRPASSGRRRGDRGDTAGCGRRDGSWGDGGGGGALDDKFGCLQARLAKTVESSSNFVGDIRRLRKAGGLGGYARDSAAAAAGGRTPRAVGAAATAAAASELSPHGLHAGTQDTAVYGIRGSPTAAALAPSAGAMSTAEIEPLALAKEVGIQAIVNRITHAIMHERPTNIGCCGGGRGTQRRRGGGGRGGCLETGQAEYPRDGVLLDENTTGRSGAALSPSSSGRQCCHPRPKQVSSPPQAWPSGDTTAVPSPPCPSLSSPHGSPKKGGRPKEDVERLRRVVRDTMASTQRPSSSSSLAVRGGGVSPGGDRGRTQTPQWSQKHEACLAGLRRMLRATGSPLMRAKDPAILVGALLRRQGPLIKRLDDAVVSLQETAEALDALVSMSSRLRIADVSADGLFTRAGVVKDGDGGGLGSAPINKSKNASDNTGNAGGLRGKSHNGRADERAAPTARRCSVKRIHVEIHRVLGDVASFREFKIALVACARGRGRGGDGDCGGAGMEWITLDQLDHSFRTCHFTRRALDPQGASHPPLTGKRVTRFLEEMKASSRHTPSPQASALVATATAAGLSSNAATVLRGKENPTTQNSGCSARGSAWSRAGATSRGQSRGEKRRAAVGRKRAGKWNDDDRDLAERELAAVILLDQESFVDGYVRERKRYLSRRVSAQREGHAGFRREGGNAGGRGGRSLKAATDAKKAEFAEAVNRTKIVLKLLEAKRAAAGIPPPEEASQGTASKKNDPSGKLSPAVARAGGAKARRNRRRPASAPAAAASKNVRKTLPRQKEADQKRGGNLTAKEDGKNETRSMKKVLRASTEAYSDRIDRDGGGAAKTSTRGKPRGRGMAAEQGGISRGTGGRVAAGAGGGERGMMFAAAKTVQVAFRQRMFHRFVWAQAYLRSPAHAHGVFTRCLPVSRGGGGNGGFGTAPARIAPLVAALGDARSNERSTSPAAAGVILPQLPGAAIIEDFDASFLGYIRWRRCKRSTGSLPDAPSMDKTMEAARPAAEAASMAAGGTSATALLCTGSSSVHPSQTCQERIEQQQQQQQQQEEQPPQSAYLFERKHKLRTAAVRSVLVDLRVPFLPGALEAAVEDLERTIARENASSAAVTASGSRGPKPHQSGGSGGRTGIAVEMAGLPTTKGDAGRGGAAVSGRLEHPYHGGGLSFAEWYLWWTRHLPFDPASTGCLLKTVRCAKALRAAEIAAAEGKF